MQNSFLLDPKVREKGPPKADLNQVLTLKTVEGGGFCPELRRSPAISHRIILLDFIKKHPKYKVVKSFFYYLDRCSRNSAETEPRS